MISVKICQIQKNNYFARVSNFQKVYYEVKPFRCTVNVSVQFEKSTIIISKSMTCNNLTSYKSVISLVTFPTSHSSFRVST